jgi:hypothetical protein
VLWIGAWVLGVSLVTAATLNGSWTGQHLHFVMVVGGAVIAAVAGALVYRFADDGAGSATDLAS